MIFFSRKKLKTTCSRKRMMLKSVHGWEMEKTKGPNTEQRNAVK